MDTLTSDQRSRLMSRIRSTDTKPEMVVRRLLHGMGYRYVLHDSRLPGRPDLVFPSRHAVVQVHGCFWHAHGCSISPTPKSNTSYWSKKISGNVDRDARNNAALDVLGWRVCTVWECQTKGKDLTELMVRLVAFLDG